MAVSRSIRRSPIVLGYPWEQCSSRFPRVDFRRRWLTRLRGTEALFELVRYPRILGWHAAEAPRRDLDVLGSLATVVPILRAEIPWGPPFSDDLGDSPLLAVTGALGGRGPRARSCRVAQGAGGRFGDVAARRAAFRRALPRAGSGSVRRGAVGGWGERTARDLNHRSAP